MNDSDERHRSPTSPSSPSASQPSRSQSLDQSLVQVFGGLENALRDMKTFMQVLDKNQHERFGNLIERINALHLDVVKLADAFFKQTIAEEITLGATVDAREALDRTREKLEKAAADISTEFALQKQDEHSEEFEGLPRAPRIVRRAAAYLTDLGWRYLAKLAVSALTASAVLKILWEAVAPFIPGAH